MKTLGRTLLLPLLALDATAAERDPMQPPALAPARASATISAVAAPEPAASAVARHLLVLDGRRYVIDGGLRRGVGDRLGGTRIERIDDTAVQLKSGATLPLFGGIVKRPAQDPR